MRISSDSVVLLALPLLQAGDGFVTAFMEILERCQTAGPKTSLTKLPGFPHAFRNQPQWSSGTIERATAFFHEVLGD
ncbi:MAG TPA: hypothetical protein VGL72_21695 [Bryobacteraceae bacterium]